MKKLILIFCWFAITLFLLPACQSSKRKSKAHFASTSTKSKAKKTNKPARAAQLQASPHQHNQPVPTAAAEAQEIIRIAKSYIGTPYKYGGNTRAGLDCSGLVFLAFSKKGYTLPRASYQMAETGRPVPQKDIAPGDLLFFIIGGGKKINHVGLVTEVNEKGIKFIHATTQLGVVENYLESDYYQKSFVKAIRPTFQK